MNTPPQMPQFGVPILGQQPQREQQVQKQLQQQVQAAIGQVSMGIYTHLAVSHLATLDEHQSVDQDKLRQHAKDAQVAARCYFEGIGVIAQDKGDSPDANEEVPG